MWLPQTLGCEDFFLFFTSPAFYDKMRPSCQTCDSCWRRSKDAVSRGWLPYVSQSQAPCLSPGRRGRTSPWSSAADDGELSVSCVTFFFNSFLYYEIMVYSKSVKYFLQHKWLFIKTKYLQNNILWVRNNIWLCSAAQPPCRSSLSRPAELELNRT